MEQLTLPLVDHNRPPTAFFQGGRWWSWSHPWHPPAHLRKEFLWR